MNAAWGGTALLILVLGVAYAVVIVANRYSWRELAWTIVPALLLALLIVVSASVALSGR